MLLESLQILTLPTAGCRHLWRQLLSHCFLPSTWNGIELGISGIRNRIKWWYRQHPRSTLSRLYYENKRQFFRSWRVVEQGISVGGSGGSGGIISTLGIHGGLGNISTAKTPWARNRGRCLLDRRYNITTRVWPFWSKALLFAHLISFSPTFCVEFNLRWHQFHVLESVPNCIYGLLLLTGQFRMRTLSIQGGSRSPYIYMR